MKTTYQILPIWCVILCTLFGISIQEVLGQELPNIIIIMADDMGYGDPTCYNPESKIPTPYMDSLSQEGVRFTDAHTASSVCTPSRYALLTGNYAWRSRLKKGVLWSGYDDPLIEKNQDNLAGLLKKTGYRTGIVGKWHLGMNFLKKDQITFVSPKTNHESGLKGVRDVDFSLPIFNGPNYLGFDYVFASAAGHNMAPFCYIENDFVVGEPTLWRNAKDTLFEGVSAAEVHEGWMVADWDPRKVGPDLTAKAKEFIRDAVEDSDAPFFLYLPTVSPHRPCTPPDFVKGKSQAGERGDMVVEFDWTVGQIMQLLEELKIEENTLLIVTSDNGGTPTNDDGKDYGHDSSGELRGFKGGLHEGGHRVPLLVRWPAELPAGTVNDQLVCLTDFYATFSAMFNETPSTTAGFDSFNLMPLLQESKPVRNNLVMHDYGGNFAIRKDSWKLIFDGRKATELYDLKQDFTESKNVIKEHPEKVNELQKLLQHYRWEGQSN